MVATARPGRLGGSTPTRPLYTEIHSLRAQDGRRQRHHYIPNPTPPRHLPHHRRGQRRAPRCGYAVRGRGGVPGGQREADTRQDEAAGAKDMNI
jgi:hypothetical protein